MDLFTLLPDHGLATFSAMGRVVAAFADTEEAYNYANRHPETFVRFPNGTQLQARFAIADGRIAFFDRAAPREEAKKIGDKSNAELLLIVRDATASTEDKEAAQNELWHRQTRR